MESGYRNKKRYGSNKRKRQSCSLRQRQKTFFKHAPRESNLLSRHNPVRGIPQYSDSNPDSFNNNSDTNIVPSKLTSHISDMHGLGSQTGKRIADRITSESCTQHPLTHPVSQDGLAPFSYIKRQSLLHSLAGLCRVYSARITARVKRSGQVNFESELTDSWELFRFIQRHPHLRPSEHFWVSGDSRICVIQKSSFQPVVLAPLSPVCVLRLLHMATYLENLPQSGQIFNTPLETVSPSTFLPGFLSQQIDLPEPLNLTPFSCKTCGASFPNHQSKLLHMKFHMKMNQKLTSNQDHSLHPPYLSLEWFPMTELQRDAHGLALALQQLVPDLIQIKACSLLTLTQDCLSHKHSYLDSLCNPLRETNLSSDETLSSLYKAELNQTIVKKPLDSLLQTRVVFWKSPTCHSAGLENTRAISQRLSSTLSPELSPTTSPQPLPLSWILIRDGCHICGDALDITLDPQHHLRISSTCIFCIIQIHSDQSVSLVELDDSVCNGNRNALRHFSMLWKNIIVVHRSCFHFSKRIQETTHLSSVTPLFQFKDMLFIPSPEPRRRFS